MWTTALFSAALVALLAVQHADADGATSVAWGYNNNKRLGPSGWPKAFPACGGKRQSPVDLIAPEKCESDADRELPLAFNGLCSGFHLKQHDDVFKGEVLNGTCTVSAKGGKPFSLLQFHMHSPSEHTLDGKHYDAEAHFVHKNDDGLMVVGLFVEKREGVETNKWVKDVWHQLDRVHAKEGTTLELESYHELLVAGMQSSTVYHYPGSLTTPPCDESVDWWVLQEPVVVSSADFDRFVHHSKRLPALDDGQGSRPTQPLHGRQVEIF